MSILKKSTRTLVVGGLFFILPFLVLIVAVKKLFDIIRPLGQEISKTLALNSIFGKASVLIVCFLIIIILCYFGGFLVKKGIITKWSDNVEEKLFIHLPTVQMMKFRLIGKDTTVINELWQATVFKDEGAYKIAFITKKTDKFVSLFIPEAPKIGSGEIKYVPANEFTHYPISMHDAMTSIYSFGKNLDIDKIITKH